MAISAGTYTIQGTGGTPDYTSWTAFEADIINLTGQLIGEASAVEDLNEVKLTFGVFTTTAANKLILRAQPGAKHTGKPGTGHRIWDNTAGFWGTLNMQAMHYEINDLEIVMEASDSFPLRQKSSTAAVNGLATINNCLLYGDRDGDVTKCTEALLMNGTWADFDSYTFNNCALFLTSKNGFIGDSANTTRMVCNYCVAIRQTADTAIGKSGFRRVKAVNCAAFHYGPTSGHADFLTLGAGSSNNASSDGSGDTGLINLIAADEFVSVGSSWDFHLASGSTLEGAGTNISGITTDVDGDTRHATAPDVGFDEFVAGGAIVVLILADALLSQSVDSPVLTQANTLVMADALQSVSADSPALTQASTLAVADALLSVSAESPALTEAATLAIAEVLQSISVESPVLTQANILAVAEALHSISAESPALTQANILSIADSLLSMSAESPVLGQSVLLAVSEALLSVAADSPVLTQAHMLAINKALQSVTAESPALSQANTLIISDSIQSITADNITLSQSVMLAVSGALQSLGVESPVLTQANILAVAEATLAIQAAGITLTQSSTIVVNDALMNLLADHITLGAPPTARTHVIVVEAKERMVIVTRPNRTVDAESRDRLIVLH